MSIIERYWNIIVLHLTFEVRLDPPFFSYILHLNFNSKTWNDNCQLDETIPYPIQWPNGIPPKHTHTHTYKGHVCYMWFCAGLAWNILLCGRNHTGWLEAASLSATCSHAIGRALNSPTRSRDAFVDGCREEGKEENAHRSSESRRRRKENNYFAASWPATTGRNWTPQPLWVGPHCYLPKVTTQSIIMALVWGTIDFGIGIKDP